MNAARCVRTIPRSAIACTAAAIALPKCPACIAAWLSLAGFGLSTALAVWLRPGLLALAVAFAAVWAAARLRRARRSCL